MKKWNAAEIVELNIAETAHNWTGLYKDGGYIGDGEISGHLSWTKPEEPAPTPTPTPETPETPDTDLHS